MNISSVSPQNPMPSGGESLAQHAARGDAENDADRDDGVRPSSNAAQANQRINANEASTDSRQPDSHQGRSGQGNQHGHGRLDMMV